MARTGVLSPAGKRAAVPKPLIGVLVLAIIIAILGITGVLAQARALIPGLAPAAPSYDLATVGKGNIQVSVVATGPIAAVNDAPLTFKTSGKLAKVLVSAGQQVKKGQLLAVLDTTDLQTALDQAKANLAEAQANLAKVQAGPTDDQKAVAQASLNSAKSSAAQAEASIPTTKASVADDITASQQSVHTAELSLAAAQDGVKNAEDQEKQGIAADQVAITTAQKNLDAAKATAASDIPILQQNLDKAKNSLWSTQISRDATCGHSNGTDCQAANANVASAETSVTTTEAQNQQTEAQDQQKISQAQDSLDQAKAQLQADQTKLAAAVVTAQNQVKQAQAALTSAQNGVAQAQAKATTTVQSTESQAEQAQNALKSAQANYNQSVAPPTTADIATAKAQLVTAQAAVETAQTNLDAANLTAPFDGTIAAVNGTVGQYVSGGPVQTDETALFDLVDLSDLQVTAQVNEADIAKVKVGDPVTFTVSAFPNKTFTGKVLGIQPVGTVVQNVVNYNVTCSIQGTQDATLYPGMTAAATIISENRDNVTMVPNAALSFAQTAFRDGLIKRPERSTEGQAGAGQAKPGAAQASSTQGGSANARQGAGRTAGASQGQGQQATNGSGNTSGSANTQQVSNANRGMVLTLKDGKLTPMPVTLGITDGTNTEIVSGLTGGEQIVVGAKGVNGSGNSAASGNRSGGRGGFGGGVRFIGG